MGFFDFLFKKSKPKESTQSSDTVEATCRVFSDEELASSRIFLFALSTCAACKRVKKILNEYKLSYNYTDVDLLDDDSREKVLEQLKKYNSAESFPTIIVNKKIIVGLLEGDIKNSLEKLT